MNDQDYRVLSDDEQEPLEQEPFQQEPYEDEYSDYDEELDNDHRFHLAMNVFDTISVLAGVAVVLILVALLASLIAWLRTDVTHSFTLLQSQIK